MGAGRPDVSFADFCRLAVPVVGLDLAAYKPEFLSERIERRRTELGLPSLRAYLDRLMGDARERRRLRDGVTAGVSSLYRDPALWDELAHVHLPVLAARAGRPLHVWSAGTGPGHELYTIACLLADAGLLDRSDLLGTDVSLTALARARAGVYAPADFETVPPHWIDRYFRPVAGGLTIDDGIRSRIEFRYGDLLAPLPGDGFDLILCRNVVIYLLSAAQARIFARLAEALRPGGILFLGSAERPTDPESLGLRHVRRAFYERPPQGPLETAS
ncbi:MAG TPA: protein-glutamate O-methyltransferase CheR [Dehalococcoidia bacterium]|nr:protein-glutamate O-methyltransferase CheR [Dehalococcoidia bacterium]